MILTMVESTTMVTQIAQNLKYHHVLKDLIHQTFINVSLHLTYSEFCNEFTEILRETRILIINMYFVYIKQLFHNRHFFLDFMCYKINIENQSNKTDPR